MNEKTFVACCGAPGAYAEEAARRMIAGAEVLFFKNFEAVVRAVAGGLVPYGVLPIENSLAGSVLPVYDLLQRDGFQIAKAVRVRIEHVLLAAEGVRLEDIREIASHPQALAQCGRFLGLHSDIEAVSVVSTASAARDLALSGRCDAAAIASRRCAEIYGLKVLEDDIQDAVYNMTRFICISKSSQSADPSRPGDDVAANRISLLLTLAHRPGSLYGFLRRFAEIGVNLTKIESRPIPGSDFEVRFILDFEISSLTPAVRSLLAELEHAPEIRRYQLLGIYREESGEVGVWS